MIRPTWSVPFYFCCLAFFMLLSDCAAPTPNKEITADTEFARMMSAGRVAFDRGLNEQAATLYQQALRRARAMDSAAAIGDAAYNLAACRIQLGQLEKARTLLAEAKAEIISIQGNIADIQLVEAKVARLQGNPDEALSLAEQVLSHPGSNPTDGQRLQVYLLRGHIACDRGDASRAQQELQMAERFAAGKSDLTLPAGLSGLAGRIHLIKKQPVLAAKQFDREAFLLRQAEQYAPMARALQSSAEAYLSAGNYSQAADRFFRAARSVFAQGQIAAALNLAQRALSAADTAGDQTAMARVRALLDEIEAGPGRK